MLKIAVANFASFAFGPKSKSTASRALSALTSLVEEAPMQSDRLHEIKYEAYRLRAKSTNSEL
jgi:hypothetical protein